MVTVHREPYKLPELRMGDYQKRFLHDTGSVRCSD